MVDGEVEGEVDAIEGLLHAEVRRIHQWRLIEGWTLLAATEHWLFWSRPVP